MSFDRGMDKEDVVSSQNIRNKSKNKQMGPN